MDTGLFAARDKTARRGLLHDLREHRDTFAKAVVDGVVGAVPEDWHKGLNARLRVLKWRTAA